MESELTTELVSLNISDSSLLGFGQHCGDSEIRDGYTAVNAARYPRIDNADICSNGSRA
jgi:hypothetical protein